MRFSKVLAVAFILIGCISIFGQKKDAPKTEKDWRAFFKKVVNGEKTINEKNLATYLSDIVNGRNYKYQDLYAFEQFFGGKAFGQETLEKGLISIQYWALGKGETPFLFKEDTPADVMLAYNRDLAEDLYTKSKCPLVLKEISPQDYAHLLCFYIGGFNEEQFIKYVKAHQDSGN